MIGSKDCYLPSWETTLAQASGAFVINTRAELEKSTKCSQYPIWPSHFYSVPTYDLPHDPKAQMSVLTVSVLLLIMLVVALTYLLVFVSLVTLRST